MLKEMDTARQYSINPAVAVANDILTLNETHFKDTNYSNAALLLMSHGWGRKGGIPLRIISNTRLTLNKANHLSFAVFIIVELKVLKGLPINLV